MYERLGLKEWAKITHKSNSYSMRYYIVSRNRFSSKKCFYNLNVKYVNDIYVNKGISKYLLLIRLNMRHLKTYIVKKIS